MRDVGLRISQARSKRGLTQQALADRIGRSVSSLSGYEHEAQLPPLEIANDIATVLNVSLDYLAGNSSDEGISYKSLTPEQREVLDLLMVEFATPSNNSSCFSPEQMNIIMKLGHIFSSRTL